MVRRPDVDDPPQAAVLARLLRLWGVVSGLGLALITLAQLAPPLVGILVVVGVLVVAAVVYVRIVHPAVRGRQLGLMSFLPVALRLRYLGCVAPAAVVWLWLFVGDRAEAIGRPGGLVLAAVVIAVGTVVGALWAAAGWTAADPGPRLIQTGSGSRRESHTDLRVTRLSTAWSRNSDLAGIGRTNGESAGGAGSVRSLRG